MSTSRNKAEGTTPPRWQGHPKNRKPVKTPEEDKTDRFNGKVVYVGEFPCPSGLCTKRHLYSAAEVLDAGDAGGQEDSKQAK